MSKLARHSDKNDRLKEQESRLQKVVSKFTSLVERPISFVGNKSRSLWHEYSLYVENNKTSLRNGEEAVRMFSFFMPGRFGDSSEIGELIYGLTYVFGTINDRAIDDYREPTVYVGNNETLLIKNIKMLISITQHLQIFIELLAIKNLKQKQRWKIVLSIELFKMIARLYLLYHFKGYMLIVPNENEMKHQSKLQEAQQHGRYTDLQTMYVDAGRNPHPQGHFSEESQALHENTGHNEIKRHANKPGRTRASLKEIIAELLYISRPVVYVLLFIKYNIDINKKSGGKGLIGMGTKWRAFIVAAIMDLYSHCLYMSTSTTLRQRQELKRRQMQWIFYLLLTPFFETFIKNPSDSVANYFERNNSTVKYWIVSTLMSLVCAYQQNYFNISGSNY